MPPRSANLFLVDMILFQMQGQMFDARYLDFFNRGASKAIAIWKGILNLLRHLPGFQAKSHAGTD